MIFNFENFDFFNVNVKVYVGGVLVVKLYFKYFSRVLIFVLLFDIVNIFCLYKNKVFRSDFKSFLVYWC